MGDFGGFIYHALDFAGQSIASHPVGIEKEIAVNRTQLSQTLGKVMPRDWIVKRQKHEAEKVCPFARFLADLVEVDFNHRVYVFDRPTDANSHRILQNGL